jgi:hypothetical protein
MNEPKPVERTYSTITMNTKSNKGVGTILKEKLSWFEPAGGCNSCNQKAAMMDANGPDWCETNIDTIAGWLMENARKRTAIVAIPGINQVTTMVAKSYVSSAIEECRHQNSEQNVQQPISDA